MTVQSSDVQVHHCHLYNFPNVLLHLYFYANNNSRYKSMEIFQLGVNSECYLNDNYFSNDGTVIDPLTKDNI